MRSPWPALVRTLAALALCACAPAFAAGSAIVDTKEVAEALKRHAVVWDTRPAAAYRQGHIPGAVNIDDVGTVLRDENTEDYLPIPVLEQRLGAGGIDPAKEIIVYGAKANPYVYFALVTLQYFGATNARIYHGGFEDWKASGEPVGTTPATPVPVKLTLVPRPELLIETAEVVRKLRDPAVQIVDVRTPKEFSGEDIRAIRGGHIPGAVSINFQDNWVDPDTPAKLEKKLTTSREGLNLKSPAELKALYAKLDPDKETIVYCQSGVRASETATILRELGFSKVRVYDSSWLGYGNTLEAPAENATFFNVGLLQGRLAAMQKRLETLEQELAAAKAAK
jgi:thiosulfate/3-mercaptopyruvate sulfurtransferase